MGILTRLRAWIEDRFGGGSAVDDTGEDGTVDAPDEHGLDPNNVTEVRSEGSDDAAEKLREVTERRDEEVHE